jgi:hypothetical protein
LGRQPFGLASPAAWLRDAGAEVACLDLARQPLDEEAVRTAEAVAFYLPMHTATRLAIPVIRRTREINPAAHLCAYGLYAPVNAELLRKLGVRTIAGGEFEEALLTLVRPGSAPLISLARQRFVTPDRSGLPPLEKYAQLVLPGGARRTVGYTEASRGCKHLCRHCPVVPVYQGHFRVVPREIVLEDIRRQVLPLLRETGCAFVVSAVESVDDYVLQHILEKGHTRADFVRVAGMFRDVGLVLGLVLAPTFVPFHPWMTLEGYADLLATIAELDLVEHVSPVQLTIRLLAPAGSRLMELPEARAAIGGFDEDALSYRWVHRDARVDALQRRLEATVARAVTAKEDRRTIFRRVWELAVAASAMTEGLNARRLPDVPPGRPRVTVPYLTEPWYC